MSTLDSEINKNTICDVLLQAHNNPVGKWRKVTFPVLYQEVRSRLGSSREEVLRDLRYLVDLKVIKIEKEKFKSRIIGNRKTSGGTTEYYSLRSIAIDRLEKNGTWKPSEESISSYSRISIENSTFYAPFAIGNENNIVTYDVSQDIQKILNLIDEKPNNENKVEIRQLIQNELPIILQDVDTKRAQGIVQKLRLLGGTWLVPVITQLIATYLQHKLGINQ